ncbi:hypothetical protein EBU71_20205, partial [bacterium]|nr:hypothetical protein [Candidatus Elulimicrobium humile]
MGSPLGLTFKIVGESGIPSSGGTNRNYRVVGGKAVVSLFGDRKPSGAGPVVPGGAQFSPYPTNADVKSGSVTSISSAADIHKDDMNDTSVTSLVDYTKKYPGMKLDYSDFAYLKDIGVYPNNRLVVARRFPGPVGNDLTQVKATPIATLISWAKDEEFIKVSFSEEWVEAEASFKDVLDSIGEDIKGSVESNVDKLGSIASAAFNAIPLPGFMEGIQYQVMKNMGITDFGVGDSPLGNPNLIRQAKRRSTVTKDQAGSGLKASFSVSMTVEYEQKFINGVDPTLVYLDIIQNALSFGTSDARFQFGGPFADSATGIIKDL